MRMIGSGTPKTNSPEPPRSKPSGGIKAGDRILLKDSEAMEVVARVHADGTIDTYLHQRLSRFQYLLEVPTSILRGKKVTLQCAKLLRQLLPYANF